MRAVEGAAYASPLCLSLGLCCLLSCLGCFLGCLLCLAFLKAWGLVPGTSVDGAVCVAVLAIFAARFCAAAVAKI